MPGVTEMTPEQRAAAREVGQRRRDARRAAGVPTLRESVKAKCYDCAYDPLAGGSHLDQIRACTVRICPLWPHRPGAADMPPEDYVPLPPAVVLANIRQQAERAKRRERDDAGADTAAAIVPAG